MKARGAGRIMRNAKDAPGSPSGAPPESEAKGEPKLDLGALLKHLVGSYAVSGEPAEHILTLGLASGQKIDLTMRVEAAKE